MSPPRDDPNRVEDTWKNRLRPQGKGLRKGLLEPETEEQRETMKEDQGIAPPTR